MISFAFFYDTSAARNWFATVLHCRMIGHMADDGYASEPGN